MHAYSAVAQPEQTSPSFSPFPALPYQVMETPTGGVGCAPKYHTALLVVETLFLNSLLPQLARHPSQARHL